MVLAKILSRLHTSAKPQGSQFLEPPPIGMGSGPSPPAYPLAKAFKEVDEATLEAGAKALAEAASVARVKTTLDMVAIST